MSLLVLGVSHHAVPLDLLEAVALGTSEATDLESAVLTSEYVRESVVLSTCNRTEVYAEVTAFHGAVIDIARALSTHSGRSADELQEHLYVHFEDRCVSHAFRLGAGLDSMAVGEAQILGQIRSALTRAQGDEHVGPVLNALLQATLRVGKRVHTETAIDEVSGSLVVAGLVRAQQVLGPLADARVLVIGAGGMGALAATTAQRHGIADLTIVNRGRRAPAAWPIGSAPGPGLSPTASPLWPMPTSSCPRRGRGVGSSPLRMRLSPNNAGAGAPRSISTWPCPTTSAAPSVRSRTSSGSGWRIWRPTCP